MRLIPDMREALPVDRVREILVIHVTRIGDTLLSTPTLRAIAAAYPKARLTVLGHAKRIEVLEHLPFLHRVDSISKRTAPLRGRLPAGRRYDLAFVFGKDRPLVAYALRVADRVVAFRQNDPALDSRLFHCAEDPPFQSRHAVGMQFALVEGLGLRLAGRHLSYRVEAGEARWAERELANLGAARPLIGLQIASFPTKGYRDWPVAHFAALCDRIRKVWPQAHFLIFGGKLEAARTRALHAHLGTAATHCAGRLSLRQTAALMDRLDLYIGVDTGPTHIMGALHRPLIAFYHPSSPSPNLAPLDHPCLRVIDHPRAGQAGTDAAMADIGVDAVWIEVEAMLSEHFTAPAAKAHG